MATQGAGSYAVNKKQHSHKVTLYGVLFLVVAHIFRSLRWRHPRHLEAPGGWGTVLLGCSLFPPPSPQTEGEPTKAIIDALRRRSPSIQ